MNQSAEEKELVVNINYELFVLALVVLSLVNWVLILLMQPTPAQAQVVWIMNVGLSVFLLLDFALSPVASSAPPEISGAGSSGWMLLLGSLPLPFAGVLRLIWVWLAAAPLAPQRLPADEQNRRAAARAEHAAQRRAGRHRHAGSRRRADPGRRKRVHAGQHQDRD